MWICFNTFLAGAYVTRRIAALFSRSSRQAINSEEVTTASACPFRGNCESEDKKFKQEEKQTIHYNTDDSTTKRNKYKPIEDDGNGKE